VSFSARVPRGAWLGGIAAFPATAAAGRLWADYETTSRLIPAQGWTLWSFLLLALGAGVGLLATR
jgi:hypothetical protein